MGLRNSISFKIDVFIIVPNTPEFQHSIIPAPFSKNVNTGIILACHAKNILDRNED